MTGFESKRDAAADKLQEPVHSVQSNGRHSPLLTHMMNKRTVSAQPAQEPRDIAKIVEGMEVSIDVSTGEHDNGNRLFGTVTLAQENQSSKHGLILLVQEPEPNFKTTTPPQREWVGLTDPDFCHQINTCDFLAGAFFAETKLKEKNNGVTQHD